VQTILNSMIMEKSARPTSHFTFHLADKRRGNVEKSLQSYVTDCVDFYSLGLVNGRSQLNLLKGQDMCVYMLVIWVCLSACLPYFQDVALQVVQPYVYGLRNKVLGGSIVPIICH